MNAPRCTVVVGRRWDQGTKTLDCSQEAQCNGEATHVVVYGGTREPGAVLEPAPICAEHAAAWAPIMAKWTSKIEPL